MKVLFPNRKAQLTVFIIIGIIILFSVGIFSYMKYTGISPADIFQPKSPPVAAFIESCIERTAIEALRAMGDQGGYIVIPPDIFYNPTRHVSLMPGVGGDYAPRVPYWYFDGKTQMPSIDYIQFQVEQYTNERLGLCLQGFSSLRDEFDIVELSNFSTNVLFTEKETVVGLDYRIDVAPRGSSETVRAEQFVVRLDVPVRRMWQLGKEIMEAENQKTFYENLTINLMASHPSTDIPFTGLEFTCERKQWLLSDIKKKLIKVLEPSVIATRFKNTNHPPFEENDDAYRAVHNAVTDWRESPVAKPLNLPKKIPSDSYEYFQNYFQFDTKSNYKDFKVVSTYKQDWGMMMLATPNQHGVLKSGVNNLKSEIMSFFCLNTYHFVYDVSYPVMINIQYPKAFHGAGYVFRFAFPVQVYHNAPHRNILPAKFVEPTEYALGYCDVFSDDEHTIIARDALTNAELSRVNLTFQCLTEQCVLGSTRTNNRHLQWSGNYPEGCIGPVIIAQKPGYMVTEKQDYGNNPFYIDMYPTQNVSFDVRRHQETEPDTARFLEKDMFAVLSLELLEPRLSVPLTIYEVFGSEDVINRSNSFELLRADATYELNLILIKKVDDKDMMIGGWMGNWTVSLEEMLDAKKVVFHIPQKYPTPKTDADIIAVYPLMTNRTLFPNIKPEIIRADEASAQEEQDTNQAAAST